MSTISLKLPEDVKQRATFVADAVASRTETLESGKGYSMAEVHAYIQERCVVAIESGAATGYLPRRAMSLVQEWRILRKAELISAWNSAQSGVRLPRIAPLE